MTVAVKKRTNVSTRSMSSVKNIEKKELDYWLMNNMHLMEKLSVVQPACWAEADGYKE